MDINEELWGIIHRIESAMSKDDITTIDRKSLEGLVVELYDKLIDLIDERD